MKALPTEVVGTVKEVYCHDVDSFFSAALFQEDTLGLSIRVRGKVLLGEGERVRLRGIWVSDPRFGRQLEVTDFDYLGVPPWRR